MRSAFVAGLVFALLAAPAGAVPPDAHLVLAPGSETFVKVPSKFEGVFVEPAGALVAEVLPSNELFVTVPADARGTALLVGYRDGRLHVWDVCLARDERSCPARTSVESAKASCPKLEKATEDGDPIVKVTVSTAVCFDALKATLRSSDVPIGSLRLVLDESGARLLFGRVAAAIQAVPEAKDVKVAWLGPTLLLRGRTTRRGLERALVAAWHETVGKVTFDADELELEDGPAK